MKMPRRTLTTMTGTRPSSGTAPATRTWAMQQQVQATCSVTVHPCKLQMLSTSGPDLCRRRHTCMASLSLCCMPAPAQSAAMPWLQSSTSGPQHLLCRGVPVAGQARDDGHHPAAAVRPQPGGCQHRACGRGQCGRCRRSQQRGAVLRLIQYAPCAEAVRGVHMCLCACRLQASLPGTSILSVGPLHSWEGMLFFLQAQAFAGSRDPPGKPIKSPQNPAWGISPTSMQLR